jgi:hypothetical protein
VGCAGAHCSAALGRLIKTWLSGLHPIGWLKWPGRARTSTALRLPDFESGAYDGAGGTSGSGQSAVHRNDAPNVSDGSRLCENSDVELARRISVSISSLSKPIAPVTSLGRRQLRKQFCASLAQASFHTGWVIDGPSGLEIRLPFYPRKRTSGVPAGMSVRCHFRTHAPQQ